MRVRRIVMRSIRSAISGVVVFALALVPLAASAERADTSSETWPADRAPTVETVIKKHIAALGGEKLLRAGTSMTYTVSGEKAGKKFSKTVWQVRPNKMRVEIQGDEGSMVKGFDGK